MAEAVHEYHHGDQEIAEQVETFHVFGGLMKWASLAVAILVTMLTMWFCIGTGFIPGAFAGVVILALGIIFLRSKPAEEH
ncbi:MAG: aa3-type cytochrome c oxidase subunit IV [Caulobacterales bacterium]